MQFYVGLLSNLLCYFSKNKNIILICKKHLIFDDTYKILMSVFTSSLLRLIQIRKTYKKNQPKNPLGLNNKDSVLFDSGARSKSYAIQYFSVNCHNETSDKHDIVISHLDERACCQLCDRFPQPLQSF